MAFNILCYKILTTVLEAFPYKDVVIFEQEKKYNLKGKQIFIRWSVGSFSMHFLMLLRE